ncbi:VanW family protein [Eubacteriales bacterium OttesenSCG-928-A19]|nr:VanW family protein [Eubacteriales bacterium OttesenSCG-928-A19]
MITQRLPFLLPLRHAQRRAFHYAGRRLDGHTYARAIYPERLPHLLFSASNGLYNANMGFDMTLQGNKVFNSKLAARTMDGLLIRPGETFSFWQVVRDADRHTPYRDGSVVRNGKLCVAYGGGLCQLSNLLFWVFLNSPLTIVERQTHRVKDFPTLRNLEPEGVDATISEGWIDLRMKNETDATFQIAVAFDSESITVSLYTDRPMPSRHEIEGRNLTYFRKNGKVYQRISIYRRETAVETGEVLSNELLYTNLCVIEYELPERTTILEGTSVFA